MSIVEVESVPISRKWNGLIDVWPVPWNPFGGTMKLIIPTTRGEPFDDPALAQYSAR